MKRLPYFVVELLLLLHLQGSFALEKDNNITYGISQKNIKAYKLWPEVDGLPEIPFRFRDDMVNQVEIRKVIKYWEEHTCLRFKEVTSDYTGNHIYFQRHDTLCHSYIGMVGQTGQPINITQQCEKSMGPLHQEICHVMGRFENNVKDKISNFQKKDSQNYNLSYDYHDSMHYSMVHSRPKFKIPKIYITVDFHQTQTGRSFQPSHMDKLHVNKMYSCIKKNLESCSIVSNPCLNNGYMGKDCKCVVDYDA